VTDPSEPRTLPSAGMQYPLPASTQQQIPYPSAASSLVNYTTGSQSSNPTLQPAVNRSTNQPSNYEAYPDDINHVQEPNSGAAQPAGFVDKYQFEERVEADDIYSGNDSIGEVTQGFARHNIGDQPHRQRRSSHCEFSTRGKHPVLTINSKYFN
jgi:hypothetical protein